MTPKWLRGFRLFKAEILTVAIVSMVTNLLMLLPSLYMLQIYDRVLVSKNELTLLTVSLLTLLLISVIPLAEWLRAKILIGVGLRIHEILAERIFRAMFTASLRVPTGQTTKPLSDLTELRQYFTGSSAVVFFDLPWTPVFIAALFFLHPTLGWAAIFFGVLQAFTAFASHEVTKRPVQELTIKSQLSLVQLSNYLRASDAIHSMGMLGGLYVRWLNSINIYLQNHAKANGTQHQNIAFSKWLRLTQQSLILGLGALLVIDGKISAGAMIAANVLATRALAPVDSLVTTWRGFLNAKAAFIRITTLISEHYSAPIQGRNKPLPIGSVKLENVYASPPNSQPEVVPTLKNINLTLEPGKIVTLVGPSGSGKTSLVRVLLGIWPSISGNIFWGADRYESWSAEELGCHVGYLPQDVQIFDGSIAQNIARQGELSPVKVIEAAKSANLHDAILRLPQGYDTRIGVGGISLSGGQRQRLGLARALHGNPSLIVLDEPNANLDDVGEKALAGALAQAKLRGAAILVISHRPQLMAVSDEVIRMADGMLFHPQAQAV